MKASARSSKANMKWGKLPKGWGEKKDADIIHNHFPRYYLFFFHFLRKIRNIISLTTRMFMSSLHIDVEKR